MSAEKPTQFPPPMDPSVLEVKMNSRMNTSAMSEFIANRISNFARFNACALSTDATSELYNKKAYARFAGNMQGDLTLAGLNKDQVEEHLRNLQLF